MAEWELARFRLHWKPYALWHSSPPESVRPPLDVVDSSWCVKEELRSTHELLEMEGPPFLSLSIYADSYEEKSVVTGAKPSDTISALQGAERGSDTI